MNAGANAWQWYSTALIHRPLLTKSSTAALVMALSDVACQELELSLQTPKADDNMRHSSSLSWHRTMEVAITGFVWSGPISHSWYQVLESTVNVQNRLLGIMIRLALDAALFSPFAVAGYFVWRTLLEGGGIRRVVERLKLRWKGALFASWRFWPIANIANFAFVPVQFRVLYNNSLSLLWNGYLSHMHAKNLRPNEIPGGVELEKNQSL